MTAEVVAPERTAANVVLVLHRLREEKSKRLVRVKRIVRNVVTDIASSQVAWVVPNHQSHPDREVSVISTGQVLKDAITIHSPAQEARVEMPTT